MGSLLPTNELILTELFKTIIIALEQGASEREAAIAAGFDPKKIGPLKRRPEVLEAFAIAKAKSKVDLVGAVHKIATKGSIIRETRRKREVVEQSDGTNVLKLVEETEIIRELPPDGRVGMQLLKATYPEEYGDVKRIDISKLGSAKQIDLDSQPESISDPKEFIDMILNGDGSYVPDLELGPEEKTEIVETLVDIDEFD